MHRQTPLGENPSGPRKRAARGLGSEAVALVGITLLGAGLLGTGLIGIAGCSGGKPAEAPAEPDAAADALVQRMVAAYAEADTYFDNAEYWQRHAVRGEGVLYEQPPHIVAVAFARPNRVRVVRDVPGLSGPPLHVEVCSDGKRLRAVVSDTPGEFLDRSAPEALSAPALAPGSVLAQALFPVPIEALYPQLDLLMTREGGPRLLRGATASMLPDKELAGDADQGVLFKRVRLDTAQRSCILWINPKTHLLRRYEVVTSRLRQALDPQDTLARFDLWIDFKDAAAGAEMADATFELKAPEGSRAVEEFTPKPDPPAQSGTEVGADPLDPASAEKSASGEPDTQEGVKQAEAPAEPPAAATTPETKTDTPPPSADKAPAQE